MGQGSGRRQSRKARHGEIMKKSWSNRTKIWGAGTWGEVMQATPPLSVVLNRHCFVWMPAGGVRNYFGEQYGDLTILEKNSNTLSSCTYMFLTTTSMLIVTKSICLALTSLHLSMLIFNYPPSITWIYCIEFTSNSTGPRVNLSYSLMFLLVWLCFMFWLIVPRFVLSPKPKI